MHSRVRYPRVLAVLRTLVYLGATLGGVLLLSVAVSFLGVVALLSLASFLLIGDVSELVLLLVGGLGLVTFGSVGLLLVSAAGRIDRFLLRTARVPSPLERVTARYVRGDIEEIDLERDIEKALAAEAETDGTDSPFDSPAGSPSVSASPGKSLELGKEGVRDAY